MNDFKHAAQMSDPHNNDGMADKYDRLAREYIDSERSVQEGFESFQAGDITSEDFEQIMENHADVTRRANQALKTLHKEAGSRANTGSEKQKLYEKFAKSLSQQPQQQSEAKPEKTEKDVCGNAIDEKKGLPKVDWKAHKDFFR